MEFLLGGLSAAAACLFTNPLELVKTRMQLQGELRARGDYTVHYRNFVHAFYTICKHEGVWAVQKGLVPAVWFQIVMNGTRLGSYRMISNAGLLTAGRDAGGPNKSPIYWRSILAGAVAGALGASVASPLYLVKTQLQSRSLTTIAVGHQHRHGGMMGAFQQVWRANGLRGLWHGVSVAVVRTSMGSATQLSTFAHFKQAITARYPQIFPHTSWLTATAAALSSGLVVVSTMTPFDVVMTRMYNQDYSSGRGAYYSGAVDCARKIFHLEGPLGFYKGVSASFYRLVPHTVLSLVFWDQTWHLYKRYYQ